MKFHVRIIQFAILLALNKYNFNIHQFLVKSKTEFLIWLKNTLQYSHFVAIKEILV